LKTDSDFIKIFTIKRTEDGERNEIERIDSLKNSFRMNKKQELIEQYEREQVYFN
jgi:hypothetical protein